MLECIDQDARGCTFWTNDYPASQEVTKEDSQ